MKENKKIWDDFWKTSTFNLEKDKSVFRQGLASVCWKKIENIVISRYGSLENLKVIEIGSGRGEMSSLMASKGARARLLDYSSIALERARVLFNNLNLQADFILADCLDMPIELLGKFDISMSFGLAEHFDFPQRKAIFQIHKALLNERGICVIEVPNKYCLPYRIFKKVAESFGYWATGPEITFSRSELKRIALASGFKDCKILGSSFMRDSFYYLFARIMSRLTNHRWIPDASRFEIASFLDNHFGRSLVLIGMKT